MLAHLLRGTKEGREKSEIGFPFSVVLQPPLHGYLNRNTHHEFTPEHSNKTKAWGCTPPEQFVG